MAAGAGIAVVAAAWMSDAKPWEKAAGITFSAVLAVALFWRRRTPILAGLVVSSSVGLFELIVREAGVVLVVPLLIAFYSIAAYTTPRRALAGFALAYAITVAGLYADPNVRDIAENAVFVAIVAGSAWAGGLMTRANRARSAQLADLAAQLQRERDEKARLAVAAERARIARELHDVVAHGISVIAVQAGAGRHALHRNPDRTQAALSAIETTARQALVEMRHMLGLLRERGDTPSAAPLPGLADHETLIDQARADGLSVELAIDGEARSLPPGIDLAGYRILQESLTNVRKHAPGSCAQVRIRYTPAAVEIVVQNNGPPATHGAAHASGGGHGLIGMRERVALYGGTLEAGPLPEGGFSVQARLPLDQDRP